MLELYEYIERGYNDLQLRFISKYDNISFNSEQMQEIRLGLEQGLDVSKYTKKKL